MLPAFRYEVIRITSSDTWQTCPFTYNGKGFIVRCTTNPVYIRLAYRAGQPGDIIELSSDDPPLPIPFSLVEFMVLNVNAGSNGNLQITNID